MVQDESEPAMHVDPPAYLAVLDLGARSCLVVGHGFSANRRAAAMEACGAVVTRVSCHGYVRGMAAGFGVVVTCDRRVDDHVLADALEADVPVHVVGDPDRSTMSLPRPILRRLVP
jgi:siroheme synthase (precorrin-2 oxidase/ferrochelatase)